MWPRLAHAVLDRATHRRDDPEWLAEAWQRAKVVVVDPETGNTAVEGDPPCLCYVESSLAPEGVRLFLGGEQQPYFAVIAPVSGGKNLREAGPLLSDFDVGVLAEAVALARWHADHQFDAANGLPNQPSTGGWARRNGDRITWPRTDPAIMVIISDGADRVLLANGVNWPRDRFSCLAGFVEPGESAEAAVHREVEEEVGIPIEQLRYVASQPWPFPRSLMLAFEAVADPDATITPQQDEIASARWFKRDELRAALAGEEAPLRVPPSISIAHFLMERWATTPRA